MLIMLKEQNYQILIDDLLNSVVLGVMIQDDKYVYFLHGSEFPKFETATDFTVVDAKLSGFFVKKVVENGSLYYTVPEFNEKFFFDNLDYNAPREIYLYRKYLSFLSREFSQPFFKDVKIFEDHWIYCPYCEYVFQDYSYWGAIICPECHKFMNNPYVDYKKLYSSEEINLSKYFSEAKNMFFDTVSKTYMTEGEYKKKYKL